MVYAIGAIVVGFLGFLIWFAIRERRAGAVTEQAKVATKTVETMKRQDEAAAKAPRSRDQVLDALEKGEF